MDYKVIYQLIQSFRNKLNNFAPISLEGLEGSPCESPKSETDLSTDFNYVTVCGHEAGMNDARPKTSVSLAELFSAIHHANTKTRLIHIVNRLNLSSHFVETRLFAFNRIHSMSDLISRVYEAFEPDRLDVALVQFLLESYMSSVDDWMRYANFDKDRYTRNLVDDGNGKFNFILLCWSQGQQSSVHDHAQAHCFMKMLQGSLTEVRYQDPNQTSANVGDDRPLRELSRTELNENDVCYINDSIGLHKVGNSGPHPYSVSLHLYSPPFQLCTTFDPRTGQKSKAQMTFWSKFGERLS